MPAGSTWRLFIPPELAYGRRSKLAYQTVVMDLELIAVN
jgi:FKBP-type peptidyl-prolyl cis-trans isomerase